MPFTGDLEHLPIVDIIQLVHTTRKSGIFSVKGSSGQSRIVFKNGYIVGANHMDSSVRIGSVLVKMGAITVDDLKQGFAFANTAQNRMTLLSTLVQMGKLKPEEALRGLRKLVELTIVELMGWTKGTFTFDTDTVIDSSEGEQDLAIDAQMVLMDALRILDERERDIAAGKEVPSSAALYADVLPGEGAGETKVESSSVTADDLGLGDLDSLEKKIPRPASEMEIFDPIAIHRQQIRELLPGFTPGEQEAFVSFLKKPRKAGADAAPKQANKAVVLFSRDALIGHSVMSLCSDEGIVAFATDDEKELDRILSQCFLSAKMPVVVIDAPVKAGDGISGEQIANLRKELNSKYSVVPLIQFASSKESDFILQSYQQGVRAVFPKPSKEDRRETYITDMIQFLDAFRSYVRSFQHGRDDDDKYGRNLKDAIAALSKVTTPSEAPLVVLTAVAGMFERAVTFIVRAPELIGERAIGISTEKSQGPAAADRLKIQLAKPSVFRDVVEKGRVYYGESGDETLRTFFTEIGKPLSPAIVLLPLICDQKVMAVIYGDFGKKEPSPVRMDMLETLSMQAGIALEYAIFRRQAAKAAQK